MPVRACLPGELDEGLEVVLLAVKSMATEQAVTALLPHLGPESWIVSAQNGLNEEAIAALAGRQRTVGGFVNFGADYIEPGRIRYYGHAPFYLGELDGTVSERVRRLAAELATWGEVKVTSNIQGYLWTKLGYVAMLTATALVDEVQVTVMRRHPDLMAEVATEIYEVALAEGVQLEPESGLEPSLYVPREGRDEVGLRDSIQGLIVYAERYHKPKSGIWRDLAVRKRKTEIEHGLGEAVRRGERHGLDLPLVRRTIELVHDLENGRRQMGWANLAELEEVRRAPADRVSGDFVRPYTMRAMRSDVEPRRTEFAPSLKQRLQAGEVVVGSLLAYPAPWLVEVLGLTGHDFVSLDLEHEPFNDESVLELIRVADGVGLPTIVRMPCSERLVPFLSAGVSGLQVPDLRDRQHAEEIVAATRFHPVGRRTYYTQTRSARYGLGVDEAQLVEEANRDFLLIGMIESIELVEQLDEVLAVQGIDAFHVGPLDLAQSMGNPPPEEVEAVIDNVVRRCRAAGKHVAVGVVTPWNLTTLERRVDQGVQIFGIASAWFLTHAIGKFFNEVSDQIPSGLRRGRRSPPVARNPYLTDRGNGA